MRRVDLSALWHTDALAHRYSYRHRYNRYTHTRARTEMSVDKLEIMFVPNFSFVGQEDPL